MDEECVAEFVDGSLDTSMCGCEDCTQADHDEIETQYETGSITYAEAIDAHNLLTLH